MLTLLVSQNQAEYCKAMYKGIKYRPNLIHLSSVPSLITILEKSSDHVLNIINGNKMILVMA